ncbi:hypothetical protein [Streptomyces sp. NPDC045470]|uniref:hypothetical protein n=1 Tax=Streptomyces sp. NPDC045470 TaxID=3155469 RepID=UPI003405C3F2
MPAPFWGLGLACVVLTAVALLVALALVITRLAVRKARPEDLPEALLALGHVFVSLSSFLPWGRKDTTDPPAPAPAPEIMEVTVRPPTIDITAARTVLIQRPLAPTAEEERR